MSDDGEWGTGALTFLFTDIEGSTQRWRADRAGMGTALAEHDATLAAAVRAHGGRMFKHTGDGVCAVFTSPAGAVTAALDAQAGLAPPVRMGVHTGEAEERDGDWFGPTLNECARIMDTGHGGQVLVSAVTRSLLGDVDVLDLGEHLLKDLGSPRRMFQLGTAAFPPLRHTQGRTVLPNVLTSLHGRDDLVAEVVDRLGDARVVTLVGVGGVGKTRVALAVAEPSVKVLTTSREALAVDGEHVVAVPGLDGSDDRSPCVELFVERARAASPSFTASGAERLRASQICGRLDGIPLAVELAAARVPVMSTADLLSSLDLRFDVLTGGRRRRGRDRHRTLRETVDWSHDLLDDGERDLFARLAVFAGGFDLEGAAAVAGDRVAGFDVLDLVGALVDKSLLAVVDADGQRRYRYLETIRVYGDERLDAAGLRLEVTTCMQAHLTARMRDAVAGWYHAPVDDAHRIRVEIPNLRAAFDAALAVDDVDTAAGLIAPLAELVGFIGWQVEGWAGEVLERPGFAGHPAEPAMRSLAVNDLLLRGEFGSVPAACRDLLSAATSGAGAGSEPVPGAWWAHMNAAYGMHLAGDDDVAVVVLDVVLRLPGIRPDRARRPVGRPGQCRPGARQRPRPRRPGRHHPPDHRLRARPPAAR